MNAADEGNTVEVQQLAAQPTLSVRATVPLAQLAEAQGDQLQALLSYLHQCGVEAAGPPFVRYHTFGDEETDLEVGIPMATPVAGRGRVANGELAAGPAVTTWHTGGHDKLADAYTRLNSWLQEHDRKPDGSAWEVYYWIDPSRDYDPANWPEPANWRTLLVQPLNQSQTSGDTDV